ncbi:STAS-like domain-containing protein [Burkholderia pseudomallei]|uniref:STAS-like domain-containing protein n=1 Tax=Burkholderia pseudomallei TaxID=28450 RepID=UPI00190F8368|nr:STAS-like domain-containing protein [Burkholderia pseudomallei]
MIVATLDFSDPGLLEDALRFRGVKHSPFGYVEAKYESNADGDIYFKLVDESTSFGSRVSGKPVRLKLDNLLKMSVDRMVSVDFEGVPILSSSFADEVFGKLFLSIGPIKFLRRVKLVNMRETVEGLVNKAIEQRMKVGISDADE